MLNLPTTPGGHADEEGAGSMTAEAVQCKTELVTVCQYENTLLYSVMYAGGFTDTACVTLLSW